MITLLSATCHFSAWFFAQLKSWMLLMLASWKDTKSYRRKVLFQVLFDLFGWFPYLYYTRLERREDVFTLTFCGGGERPPWPSIKMGANSKHMFDTENVEAKFILDDVFWGELEVMQCKLIGYFERFNIWLYMIVDSYICWSCIVFPIHRKRPRYKSSFELWGS